MLEVHKKYDFLIVGAGLFGAIFAYEASKQNKSCIVLDRRNHIGGNIYTENIENINVHRYGAHIFHTSNRFIWDYINNICEFNNYINSPIANYKGEIYNLPFNMNTFNRLWNVITPKEAEQKLNQQRQIVNSPQNLEQQAISLVGHDIYTKLIKGYTQKQWGRECKDLPPFIIRRIPIRFTYNNNYFNDIYQGVAIGGYSRLIEKLLQNSDIELNTDYLKNRSYYSKIASKVIYTGAIDEYFNYCFGELEYRSLKFETQVLNQPNYQGNAVVNYTDEITPYTRIIEHKHFEFGNQENTVITYEYPQKWLIGLEPYYPINDKKNQNLYLKYKNLSLKENRIVFGGRLGEYKYYDMDKVVESALYMSKRELIQS